MSVTIADISELLASHTPAAVDSDRKLVRAAVAMIFRQVEHAADLLLIERAEHPGDPWSGNIGFPGGKVEPADQSPQQAAERETREELAVDLSKAQYLGYLGQISGAHLPICVSCYVYAFATTPDISLNEEVIDAFWVPLSELILPERHCALPIHFRGEMANRPGIRLPQPDKPLLWGLTYRLVMELFRLLRCEVIVSAETSPVVNC